MELRELRRMAMTISVELPIEDGELIVHALDKAVRSEDVGSGPETAGEGWPAQQADALLAMAQAYLAGGPATPNRLPLPGAARCAPITTRSSYTSTRRPCVEGPGARTCRSRRSGASPAMRP